MKTFKVSKNITIECNWVNTRYGFRHDARLLVDGWERDRTKICYYNRTWESFEYESVLEKLLSKTNLVTKRQKTIFFKRERGEYKKAVDKQFGFIAGIAKLGDILCDNQKDKNDWKARMIKAGMGEGLIMPDDWGTLSENEKQTRLDNVIKEMEEK
jgi:hypothetical protein